MRLANLRKKAILGIPLPLIAILTLTISAGLALFILEQRFGGSMTVTADMMGVYEADGSTPLGVINGMEIPADIKEWEKSWTFVVANLATDGTTDLALWAYVEGLDPTVFDYTVIAVRDEDGFALEITDTTIRAAGATMGLTNADDPVPARMSATCTLTMTLIDNEAVSEGAIVFELVVLGEQVDDWTTWE